MEKQNIFDKLGGLVVDPFNFDEKHFFLLISLLDK
jgi:hypothetical protein